MFPPCEDEAAFQTPPRWCAFGAWLHGVSALASFRVSPNWPATDTRSYPPRRNMASRTSITFRRNLLRLGLLWTAAAGAAFFSDRLAPGAPVDSPFSESGFTCRIHGQPGGTCVIQTSPDLVNWTATTTNHADASGLIGFTDAQAGDICVCHGRR